MFERKRKKDEFQDPNFSPDPALYENPKGKTLFGLCLRSHSAHGKVVAFVHPPIPENFTLVQRTDIPGSDSFQVFRSRFPLLNDEEVQYLGEPMALLAGPDEKAVREFARRVRFVTRKLSLEEFAETLPQLKRKELAFGDPPSEGDLESGELETVEGVYTSGLQDHGNQDPLEAFANVVDGQVYVKVRSQWPAHVVGSIARALDVDPVNVHVLADVSSAAQNSQVWYPSSLATHAALLSQAAQRPVRMSLTKEEEFFYSPKRPESRILLRSVVGRDGRVIHLNADVVVQVGAYGVLEEEVLDRVLVGLLAEYTVGGYQVNAHLELSHTPPRGLVGGLGEALGLFAIENHVYDICNKLDIDPGVWRVRNTRQKDQVSFTGEPFRLEIPLRSLVESLTKTTDFTRKYAAFQLLRTKHAEIQNEALPLRGVGLATGFQGNGFLSGSTSPASVEARLESDGKLSLYIPLPSSNERQLRMWQESAGAALQIHPDNVRICPVFTGEHPGGGPAVASRSFEIIPRLVLQACEGIAQRRFRQPLPITVRKVNRRAQGAVWDSENFTGQPFLSFSWGAAVAEVEVIPLLAEIRIKKISLLIDAGPRIDENAARDALCEGVMAAVGWTITENIQWEKLALSHASFLKYRLPGPREVPEIDIRFYEGAKDSTPRGLGNLGSNLTAPALLSAIRQALTSDLKSIPVSRKMLDEALRNYEAQFDSRR